MGSVAVPADPDADGSAAVMLRDVGLAESSLLAELEEADVVIMVATTAADGAAASVIGAACTVRAIMTAALVIGEPAAVAGNVSLLSSTPTGLITAAACRSLWVSTPRITSAVSSWSW